MNNNNNNIKDIWHFESQLIIIKESKSKGVYNKSSRLNTTINFDSSHSIVDYRAVIKEEEKAINIAKVNGYINTNTNGYKNY